MGDIETGYFVSDVDEVRLDCKEDIIEQHRETPP